MASGEDTLKKLAKAILVVAGAAVAVVSVTLLVAVVRWLSHRPVRVAAIGGLVVIGSLLVLQVLAIIRKARSRWILEWKLDELPSEGAPVNPLASLPAIGETKLTMRETVELLDGAASDKRVRGLLVHLGAVTGTMAAAQEVRAALGRFRAAGKPIVAFSDSYGEGGGNLPYYLASVADEVVLQPGGSVGLVGFGRDVNFVRGALDKAGIQFQVGKRHEYKNALDQLAENRFTEAHREHTERLLRVFHDQVVRAVADGRNLAVADVEASVQRGPLEAEEALAAGLVDRLAYRDEAIDAVKANTGVDRLLYVDRYKKRAKRSGGRGGTLGVVTATGTIVRKAGPLPVSPFGPSMDAGVVAAALRKAASNKRVKAIVLRVDSPGGSAVASETIWREVVRARDVGKPVVVSMGGVAASGGYWISTHADRIVAHPGTVTGSIGVVAGKPVLAKLKKKIGFNVEQLSTGAHASMYSANRVWSKDEMERVDSGLDAIYDKFTTKVAEGRKLPLERVLEIAKGRVWTGEDALAVGLVDTLGGYSEAVTAAKELAGIPADAKVRLRAYPKAPSGLGAIRKRKDESSEDKKAAAALLLSASAAAALAGPVVEAAAVAGLFGDPGAVHAGFTSTDWTFG